MLNLALIRQSSCNEKFVLMLACGFIKCDEVVRVVPNKRLVCRGVWAEQQVYAKFFFGHNAKNYALRDKAGVDALQSANIQTPALLQFSEIESTGNFALVFSAIENSKNAEEVWCDLSDEARFNLALKLVKTVAQHHHAGLMQTDLYLKNFLVAGDVIYTLDGDGIRPLSKIFRSHQQLNNLATLFSKMDALEHVWIERLYQAYCDEIGTEFSVHRALKVRYLTQKIRHHVARGYAEKKVFRTCTDVKTTKSIRCFEAVASDFSVENQDLLSLDPFLMDAKVNIKNGNTCTVGKAVLADKQVVIKRYNIKHFWHGVSRAFRPSRAANSWANAHRLIISNVATAKPLALVEERFGCLRRRAYYLSEYVDAPDVLQFFKQSTNVSDQKIVAQNIAALFYKFYLLKFSHGDFKASNVKIVNLSPVLIDLDGLQDCFGIWLSDWRFERAHIKDLQRFMKNWQSNSEASNLEISALLKQAFIDEYAVQPSLNKLLFRAGIT